VVEADPHDELVNNGAYCLAQPGEADAIYLPRGGNATVQLRRDLQRRVVGPGNRQEDSTCAGKGRICLDVAAFA
jgi:hypothetical protein